MNNHPECQKDEEFIGNTTKLIDNQNVEMFNAHLGNQAYDINGNPLDTKYYKPTFIPKSHYAAYNRHQENIFKQIRSGTQK